jgi:hypothetical protein
MEGVSRIEHSTTSYPPIIKGDEMTSSVESASKLLAISRISGTTLYVKKFDTTLKYEGQLLGIGINALRVFLLDSFKRTNINCIKVDELTVRMANIDDVIVYYVHTGDKIDHEYRFTQFLERIVSMDCWTRFSLSEHNVYKTDSKSISLMVEEIFLQINQSLVID